jgi:ferric-dicitrate binding protein FerR (iron transport regulator)
MKQLFTNTTITFELLIQFLEGTIEDSAKQLVEEWISADIQHSIFLNRLREIWSQQSDLKELGKHVVDADWAKISQRIGKDKQGKTVKYAAAFWMGIAAILVILVALAGGYFLKEHNRKVPSNDIVYNEIIIPFGQKSQLILSDGTKVWINAGTKLRFPNRFGGNVREIWLNGEAFFDVAKDASKPFYVRTNDLNIRALGTSFNVKAYDDESIVETTLVTGKIRIEKNKTDGTAEKEVILEPNCKAIFIKNESVVLNEKSLLARDIKRQVNKPLEFRKILVAEQVKIEPIVSWTEGRLVFEDESFENIAKQLERRYGIQIVIDNEELKNCRYTGVLKKVSVEQAMKALQLTTKFAYTINDNILTITTLKNR